MAKSVEMNAVPLRKLKARMVAKDLSLREVSKLSGVGYSLCSLILSGRYNDAEKLAKIRRVINQAPMPEEAAA